MTSILVRVRPGEHPRTLSITASGSPDLAEVPHGYIEHVDPLTILDAFYGAAVGLGCLGPATRPEVSRESESETTKVFRMKLPAMPLEALGPLVSKLQFAHDLGGPAFSIEEQGADSAPLLEPTQIAQLPRPTPRFSVALPKSSEIKDGRVVITFVERVREDTFERVKAIFAAWAGLLVGGFPGPGEEHPSAGFVMDVGRHLPTEIVASLEFVTASNPAWYALVRAFEQVDREMQAVAELEIY